MCAEPYPVSFDIMVRPALKAFPSISIKDLDRVSLLNRTDTKFLLHGGRLNRVLEEISNHYAILEIDKNRIFSYDSYYFDTPDNRFFLHHHNGNANRKKVRIRKYVDTGQCYLEVKRKNGKGETVKSRKSIAYFEPLLTEDAREFIRDKASVSDELLFSLRSRFKRITLVNRFDQERATIDLELTFSIDKTDSTCKEYGNIVIIEVKQGGFNRNAPIILALKKQGVLPFKISKYCIGRVSLDANLKYNLFKKKLLKIKRLQA